MLRYSAPHAACSHAHTHFVRMVFQVYKTMSTQVCIFDQSVVATLLQPLCNSPRDFKAYVTQINMKLIEQRNEISGEKELKFEISKNDDFEFLYAEILNNDKYQILAQDHDLIVDFDTFPKILINFLSPQNDVIDSEDTSKKYTRKQGFLGSTNLRPTEISIKLDNDKQSCVFEISSKTPVSKGRIISIKLSAVRGDQLITHLLKILSDNQMIKSSLEKTTEELCALKIDYREVKTQNDKLTIIEQRVKELTERIKDLENELELVKEERETIRVLADEKDDEMEELRAAHENSSMELEEAKEELEIVGKMLEEEQQKYDLLQKTQERQRKELRRLQSENDILLTKNEEVKKLLKTRDEQNYERSFDVRKLKELEADLHQKDSIIMSLTASQSLSKKELEDERLKLRECEESCRNLKTENDDLKRRLHIYRDRSSLNSPIQLPVKTKFRNVLPHISPLSTTQNSRMNSLTPSDRCNGQLGKTPYHYSSESVDTNTPK